MTRLTDRRIANRHVSLLLVSMTHKQTKRQTDPKIDRPKARQTLRQTQRQADPKRDKPKGRPKDRQTQRDTDPKTNPKTDT